VSLDLLWLKDDSLEDSANLPEPHVIAAEIAEDLQAAAEQFALIANDLQSRMKKPAPGDDGKKGSLQSKG
jgi:hypothetical protein